MSFRQRIRLYDVEDRAKSFTPDERRALRERESRPIVERIFARLAEHRGELRPTSQLAQAAQYSLNRRDELLRFLDDGLYEASLSGQRYVTNSKKKVKAA